MADPSHYEKTPVMGSTGHDEAYTFSQGELVDLDLLLIISAMRGLCPAQPVWPGNEADGRGRAGPPRDDVPLTSRHGTWLAATALHLSPRAALNL